MNTESRWMRENPLPSFPALDRNMTVDAAIVGGGMTGISTAYLLKRAGLKVALLERHRLASGETDHTTAHLTYVTDQRLTKLIRIFGRDHAQAVWDAGRAALQEIRTLVDEQRISCDFSAVPGFLHFPRDRELDAPALDLLKQEALLATELGFEAAFIPCAPLVNRPAIRFANQAQFHPLKYLAHLASRIPGGGSHIFENSEIREFDKSPLRIKSNGHWITCRHLVIATHVPLLGENNMLSGTLFQSKLSGYSSYVVGAKLPSGTAAPACYWDTDDPYDYVRIDRQLDHDYVIYGGDDHKTGQESDTEACFAHVGRKLLTLLPQAVIDCRWSGQVIQTNDGLPLIGEILPGQFIATGYIGNGIMFGTLAAMMARDAFAGIKNPWAELFDPHRKKILGGTWDYVKENADYPYYLLKDRLKTAEGTSLSELARGDGKILRLYGQKVACHRDEQGNVHIVSPSCTHMGCLVHWNNGEKTWDCPCHGSRFTPEGEVIAGPAEEPLVKLKQLETPHPARRFQRP